MLTATHGNGAGARVDWARMSAPRHLVDVPDDLLIVAERRLLELRTAVLAETDLARRTAEDGFVQDARACRAGPSLS